MKKSNKLLRRAKHLVMEFAIKMGDAPVPAEPIKKVVPKQLVKKQAAKQKSKKKAKKAHSHANRSTIFAYASVVILLCTTVFWAYLGAIVHQANADQLINAYLFENAKTFENALLPNAHSFLVKWPLFLLVKVFGFSSAAFVGLTILTAVVTVGIFAYILYRIERRPAVFGLLCLSLASVLLLVPNQPYAGGLLPVGMAMLTTRNLEYIIYIAALFMVARARTWWSGWAIGGAIVLGLLIASDKLFGVLALGGAVMAIGSYILLRRWEVSRMAWRWLLVALVGVGMAMVTLAAIDALNITNIVGQGGPYSIVSDVQAFVLGVIYAVLGLFTNLGANPGFDATLLRVTPFRAFERLMSPAGLGYLVNILTLLIGLAVATRLLIISLRISRDKHDSLDHRSRLTIMLIWSSIAALVSFVLTDHQYFVDARYMTIGLFTIFVCLAMYSTRLNWNPGLARVWALIVLLAVFSGVFGALENHSKEQLALQTINQRNESVSQALESQKAKLLVGDYWRVVPTKLKADNLTDILPLSDCTTPRQALSSKAWEADLKTQSFAYLLSFDRSLTDFPQCDLNKVVEAYGRPNSSVVIDGSVDKPTELLLFYDKGISSINPGSTLSSAVSSVVPRPLDNVIAPDCLTGHTVMNVVAHEDDDLLFMNPDLIANIKAGNCVRTVFLTAGDAGSNKFYWLGREQGAQAAYDVMDGPDEDVWINRIVKIKANQYITISSPRDNPNISLIFVRLPDGNLHGQGFGANRSESLSSLEKGGMSVIRSVDGQSFYQYEDLTRLLSTLIDYYDPTEINTQAEVHSDQFADHSDHIATGRYVRKALEGRDPNALPTLRFYMGYPVRDQAENVFGEELIQKQAAFFAYAKHDGAVCGSVEHCAHNDVYSSFLSRQYRTE